MNSFAAKLNRRDCDSETTVEERDYAKENNLVIAYVTFENDLVLEGSIEQRESLEGDGRFDFGIEGFDQKLNVCAVEDEEGSPTWEIHILNDNVDVTNFETISNSSVYCIGAVIELTEFPFF